MLKISTKGRYAIEALLYIASYSDGKAIKLKQIKENTKISEKYLEQILYTLRKENIITTVRGAKGGYYIAQSLDELTVGKVLRAMEGELVPVACVSNPGSCVSDAKNDCLTRSLWVQMSNTIDEFVDSITLQELKDEFLGGKFI